jgi:hypothetical protein
MVGLSRCQPDFPATGSLAKSSATALSPALLKEALAMRTFTRVQRLIAFVLLAWHLPPCSAGTGWQTQISDLRQLLYSFSRDTGRRLA